MRTIDPEAHASATPATFVPHRRPSRRGDASLTVQENDRD